MINSPPYKTRNSRFLGLLIWNIILTLITTPVLPTMKLALSLFGFNSRKDQKLIPIVIPVQAISMSRT